jgi:hypothetical protein
MRVKDQKVANHEVGRKRNSIFGLEMGSNEWSKLHIQWLFTHKREKKQAITALGHVVEAQHLPKPCQLHFQNWTFDSSR